MGCTLFEMTSEDDASLANFDLHQRNSSFGSSTLTGWDATDVSATASSHTFELKPARPVESVADKLPRPFTSRSMRRARQALMRSALGAHTNDGTLVPMVNAAPHGTIPVSNHSTLLRVSRNSATEASHGIGANNNPATDPQQLEQAHLVSSPIVSQLLADSNALFLLPGCGFDFVHRRGDAHTRGR